MAGIITTRDQGARWQDKWGKLGWKNFWTSTGKCIRSWASNPLSRATALLAPVPRCLWEDKCAWHRQASVGLEAPFTPGNRSVHLLVTLLIHTLLFFTKLWGCDSKGWSLMPPAKQWVYTQAGVLSPCSTIPMHILVCTVCFGADCSVSSNWMALN